MSNIVPLKTELQYQNKEALFMTEKGVYSINNNGQIKPLFQSVKPNPQRKSDFEAWSKLKPVYFQKWVWQEVCKRQPLTYRMELPVYQGQKVMMT